MYRRHIFLHRGWIKKEYLRPLSKHLSISIRNDSDLHFRQHKNSSTDAFRQIDKLSLWVRPHRDETRRNFNHIKAIQYLHLHINQHQYTTALSGISVTNWPGELIS